jgi:hypothetical protein
MTRFGRTRPDNFTLFARRIFEGRKRPALPRRREPAHPASRPAARPRWSLRRGRQGGSPA